MTTEPYTPGEASFLAAYRSAAARMTDDPDFAEVTAEARRGIAKIRAQAKADAWDELTEALEDEVSFSIADEYPNPYRIGAAE